MCDGFMIPQLVGAMVYVGIVVAVLILGRLLLSKEERERPIDDDEMDWI